MKKMTGMFLLLMMLTTMSSLGVAEEAAVQSESNILIAYFSRVGVTNLEGADVVSSASLNLDADGAMIGNSGIAAGFIQEATGGDLFQIITETQYPTGYVETTEVASQEQSQDARPALTTQVTNMDAYDTIFLVYPNWWGGLPMPLYTFLEAYDLTGKTIIPLCTHEGSGLGRSVRELETLCPDSLLLEGLAVRGGSSADSQEAIGNWIDGLGL